MFRASSLLLLAVLVAPAWSHAQAPSTTVIPGPQYRAEGIKAVLLGEEYRHLWLTPVQVRTLDLRGEAGGLTPTKRGGGLQTRSLRFVGADGREYVFRSLNKEPSLVREPALQRTVVASIIQDQVSSLHPTGSLAAAALLEAAGVAHPTPRLFIMPDDPALGEFREEFAGMLGTFEERPDETEGDRPGFGGFAKIISTEKLLERLEESPEDRVDARGYLTARLMDLLLNDWDRHADQWRWGSDGRDGGRVWRPIPRDRDYTFVDYDGVLMAVGRGFAPNAVKFDPAVENVYGLTLNAQDLDRRFLAELERAAWDSVVTSLQQRISDAVIDEAVRRLPPEHQPGSARVASYLRTRRNSLPRAAAHFYELLATDVDVYATDERDLAVIERPEDQVVEVRLFAADKQGRPKGEPYFRRRFVRHETREVRVHLHGGDDHAVVRGTVERGPMVRVAGGGGDDVLADSSRVRRQSARTAFYDARGDNRFVRGPETRVDERRYEAGERRQSLSGEFTRDWGDDSGFQPVLGFHGPDGVIVGGAHGYTRYGFRRSPYKYRLAARGMVGTRTGALAAEIDGDYRLTASQAGYSFRARASQLESLRFYGFGNETTEEHHPSYYVVRQSQILGEAFYHVDFPGPALVRLGPVVKYTRHQRREGTPFDRDNPYGNAFGQAGAQAEILLNERDERLFPRRGVTLRAGASAYPALWSASGPFAEGHATASAYWTPRLPVAPTLAVRFGGKRVWGDYPVHEAALLGGSATLRGYPFQRFAGDALAFGNAELRLPVTEAKLVVRGTLGVLALADAGRVFLSGERSDEWHRAAGAGLWFRFQVRDAPLGASLIYAKGETGRLYLKLGAPF